MGNVLPTNALDPDREWKQQNREQRENLLYRYVNLQKGGELVKLYEQYGQKQLEDFIRKEIQPLLYNEGKGKVIEKADFLRWRRKCDARLKGSPLEVIKEIDSKTDEEILQESDYEGEYVKNFSPHEACWKLDARGSVGETALHLLILHSTPLHNEIAKILLNMYPKLALDFYEGEEYYGESALHIAIVYGDFDMVKFLLAKSADVHQRATGRFFMPEDQKFGRKKTTNYIGYAYYGEYPLAFASCFGREEIYDYLIDHGADPDAKDSFGNAVLHMLVISNQLNMFGYAVKHHAKRASVEVQNNATLTPLTMSSKLGRNEIFKEIIELQSMEIWRYSNVTCAMYPLAPLDTIGPGGKTNTSSALIYITEGDSDEHLQILDGGVIKQLLDDKWKAFAKQRFFERLAITMLHLVNMSIAIYLRPEDNKDLLGPDDAKSIVRYICEITVCLYSFVNLIFQCEEVRSQGIRGFIQAQASAPAKCIFNIACCLILICIPFRVTSQVNAEIGILSFAVPMTWAFLLFFARSYHLTGPFIIMLYKMITTDIIKFTSIYTIFLFGFTSGFFFLFKDIGENAVQTFSTPQGTIMQLIQMTLGEFKYEDFDQTRIPALTKAVFFVFAILVPILLLNMLIAMMGNTYSQVISRSEKEWKRQWAKIIIVLERSYSPTQLMKFQEEYSVPWIADNKLRALMVIKTDKKTKARQRKGAIANWKKLVREIKILIKEQKMAGKTGPLDLASEEITDKLYERSLRRNNSVLKKAAGGFMGALDRGDDLIDDGDSTADNLISAMNQLAWERDLDLSATGFGQKPSNKIKEEPENERNANNSNSALVRSARKFRNSSSSSGPRATPTIMGRDNAAAVFSDDHSGDISPVETNTQKQQFNLKDLPKGSAKGSASAKSRKPNRVSPAPGSDTVDHTESSRPNSNNSNSNVSDPGLPPVSEQEGRGGSAQTKMFRPRSRKQGISSSSAKPRRSSGDSEDSKESSGPEHGVRKRASGMTQSSNSSSSLTSLMNAWEGGGMGDIQSTDL